MTQDGFSFSVGDVLRMYNDDNTFRVWIVTAVLLGGENQQSVVTIKTLDRTTVFGNEELVVPEIMLLGLRRNGMEVIGRTDEPSIGKRE